MLIDGAVFEKANVDTSLLFLAKGSVTSAKFEWSRTGPDNLYAPAILRGYDLVEADERCDISPEADERWLRIKAKADTVSLPLSSLGKVSLGMKLRSNAEFVSPERDERHPDAIYFGRDISRYGALTGSRFFESQSAVIVGGTKNQEVQKASPKIFIQAIRNLTLKRRIVATLDSRGEYFVGTVNAFTLRHEEYDIRYILGLINSEFLNTYFRKRFTTISLTAAFLGVLPIYRISFADPCQKRHHNRMVDLVDRMLELHKKLAAAKTAHEKTVLQREIETTDRQIDQLVYQLYGLTEEEIKIVEEGTP